MTNDNSWSAARLLTAGLVLGGVLGCTTGVNGDHPHSAATTRVPEAVPVSVGSGDRPNGAPAVPPTAGDPTEPASVTMPPGVGMGDPTMPMLTTTARVGSTMPSEATVTAGEELTVQLSGQAFDRVTEGGGLNPSFDPRVVQVIDVIPDATVWEFFTQKGRIDNVAGRVDGILFASFQGRRDSFPIAKVTLRALASGRPNLVLTEANAGPFASGGQRLAVKLQ